MHPTRPLEDSNYGIRSMDSSLFLSCSSLNDEERSEGSDSTVHLELSPSPSSSPPPPPPLQQPPSTNEDLPTYGPSPEPSTSNPTILSSLPRGVAFHPSHAPRLPLLPTSSASSTSSPICLSPPLSPVRSYSSISSSSPPELTNYLSDSVSSLGSLENDLSVSSTSINSRATNTNNAPNSSGDGRDAGEGSNGNLVLPTLLASGSLDGQGGEREREGEGEGGVELELKRAEEEAGSGNDALDGELRIVAVTAGNGKEHEREREGLVERLALELGVELGGTEEREGWVGRGGVSKRSSEEGESSTRAGRKVWVGWSGNDPTSTQSLLQHVRSRHFPLSQQLSPCSSSEPASLSTRDVLELAATGKGRGSRGWIDCCLIAVDEDSPSHSLSAARVLSQLTPTLLVLLQSQPTSNVRAELSSSLQRLELVSPTLLPFTTSLPPQSKLLLLDRTSLIPSSVSDEASSEGLPTPQPGTTNDPFSFSEDPIAPSFSEGLRTLFSTEKGIAYLHRFAARGFMRSRAALLLQQSTTPTSTSLASSITSDASPLYPPPRNRRSRTTTPSSASPAIEDMEIEEPDGDDFDPLHLPSALSSLFLPSLRSFTSFLLEGFAIIGLGMISVVAQSVLVGVVGEVARRLDLRGVFVARTKWGR